MGSVIDGKMRELLRLVWLCKLFLFAEIYAFSIKGSARIRKHSHNGAPRQSKFTLSSPMASSVNQALVLSYVCPSFTRTSALGPLRLSLFKLLQKTGTRQNAILTVFF